MRQIVFRVTALLIATALFLAGNGLQGTLVPVRANLEGFSDVLIAFLGSAYFVGFIGGCLLAPHAIRRAGHIRTFLASGVITGIVILMHPLAPDPVVWMILRAAVGAAAAAQFTVLDSWFHHQATNAVRGRLISIYAVVNLSALMFGQYLFAIGAPETNERFSFVAMLILASLLPVAMTLLPQPHGVLRTDLRIGRLYRISPVGFMGNVAVGLANGPFWSLAPVYAQAQGFEKMDVALFIAIVIAGAAVAQWPLGRASDFTDRRIVIAVASAAAVGAGILLFIAAGPGLAGTDIGRLLTFAGGFFFGAFGFPVGSLSSSHLNDHAEETERTEVASGILLIYGVAAAAGPALAAIGIWAGGIGTLFLFTALVHAGLLLFVLMRIRARAGVPLDERSPVNAATMPNPAAPLALTPTRLQGAQQQD